ncbi:MAG: hypothetical protein ACLP05_00715 [Candidatus Kryptoniota bacterium]
MLGLLKGGTAFNVAHSESTIRNVNHILAMKNGENVESGTHDERMNAADEFSEYRLLQQ